MLLFDREAKAENEANKHNKPKKGRNRHRKFAEADRRRRLGRHALNPGSHRKEVNSNEDMNMFDKSRQPGEFRFGGKKGGRNPANDPRDEKEIKADHGETEAQTTTSTPSFSSHKHSQIYPNQTQFVRAKTVGIRCKKARSPQSRPKVRFFPQRLRKPSPPLFSQNIDNKIFQLL